MLPSWDESCSTGLEAIDGQHRRLLGLVDALDRAELASAGAGVIGRLLDRVMDCSMSHFLVEESLMESVGYPQRDQDRMIAQHRSVPPLESFHREWLTGDEFGLDQRLADFIDADSAAQSHDRPRRSAHVWGLPVLA